MNFKTASTKEDWRTEKMETLKAPLYRSKENENENKYKGLKVLEEKLFLGPTSIRYWM